MVILPSNELTAEDDRFIDVFCNHFLMQSIESIPLLFAISMEMMEWFSQNLTENKSVGDPWAWKEIWIIIGQVGDFIIL